MMIESIATRNEPNGGSHAQPAATDVLDFAVLKSFEKVRSDDGSDITIELIDIYLQGTPQRIQEIRKAAAERQLILLKRLAHTLKGTSSTLGVRRVASVCEILESESSTQADVAAGLVQCLESSFVEARELLAAERNRRLKEAG